MNCSPPGSSAHGDSQGKNTRVGCCSLLEGIFPTQGSNPSLPHCRQVVCHLSPQGSPKHLIILAYYYCYCFWYNMIFTMTTIQLLMILKALVQLRLLNIFCLQLHLLSSSPLLSAGRYYYSHSIDEKSETQVVEVGSSLGLSAA